MVKGISRQVIVVNAPEPKLFEQAIFILKDDAARHGITDEILLQEAQQVVRSGKMADRRRKKYMYGAFWACTGAMTMGFAWLISMVL